MKFIKFPSLSSLHSSKVRGFLDGTGLTADKVDWMVTEKVHGANFGIYCDGENVSYASRSEMVGWMNKSTNIGFFNAFNVVKEIQENVKKFTKELYSGLCIPASMKSKSYVVINGELYGGSVQKKMPYGAEQKFIAFDASLVIGDVFLSEYNKIIDGLEGVDYDGKSTFVRHNPEDQAEDPIGSIVAIFDDKLKLFASLNHFGIDTVPVIATGSYDVCQGVSIEFNSRLTDEGFVDSLKLTPQQREDRLKAEGVVIEPVSPVFVQEKRIILKKRSTKFEEVKSPQDEKTYSQKILDDMSEVKKGFYVMMSDMVCENRFDSVVSKIGEVGISDFNKVQGLMFQDILDVVAEENDGKSLSDLLGKQDFKDIKTVIVHEISQLIRPLLIKM